MVDSLADDLARATQVGEHVILGLRREQWAAATPCEAWTVRDVVMHLVTGKRLFAAALSGEQPAEESAPGPEASERELLGAYRASSAALVSAFAQPGVLERIVVVPVGTVPGMVALHLRITEALVHGWDIAQATGQRVDFPADLAERELAFSRDAITKIPPDRSPFGPPRPVADDAPAMDRLVGLLGRDVTAAAAAGGQ